MDMMISTILNDEIAKAKKAADRAWSNPNLPGYDKKLGVAEGRVKALKALQKKLRNALLIW